MRQTSEPVDSASSDLLTSPHRRPALTHVSPEPTSSLDISPVSSGSSATSGQCSACRSSLHRPKLLACGHSFCPACLSAQADRPDRITCPICHAPTLLGWPGLAGLMGDVSHRSASPWDDPYGSAAGLADSGFFPGLPEEPSRGWNALQRLSASGAQSHRSAVPASSLALGPPAPGGDWPELAGIHQIVQAGQAQARQISSRLQHMERDSLKMNQHLVQTRREIHDAFDQFAQTLAEHQDQMLHDLETFHATRQTGLAFYEEKSEEALEKLCQLTDFIERLLKHASSGEARLFKRPIEQKFASIVAQMTKYETSVEDLVNFEFVSNPSALKLALKNACGLIKMSQDPVRPRVELPCRKISPTGCKQPPISRPEAPNTTINGGCSGLSTSPPTTVDHPVTSSIPASLDQGQVPAEPEATPREINSGEKSLSPPLLDPDSLFAKRFNRAMGSLDETHPLGDLAHHLDSRQTTSHDLSQLEKWTQPKGERVLFNTSACSNESSSSSSYATLSGAGLGGARAHPSLSFMDFSNKHLAPTGAPSVSSMSTSRGPPNSQIKRQKMIYHCKFGEFGVLDGQFTEPSGVAVTAQNDIIVADTNNHRIQIFDKEGRFKFQFGECGKRDGQLLYPNRVAAVRQTGDIVVTERSPTHQVQIFNHYGQFIRKFGANVLQHPRGVCVDNKGRIVVVECKVMRVIIFDQMGNVLNKFGCSKHLEFPNGVVVNDKQEIFISDNRAHCVKVFNYEGVYLRQIGGEGFTNYPIGVGINTAGEVTIADNHNNFNLSVFSQEGQLLAALESKVKHAQCFDVSLMDDGSVVLASKDYRLYIYRYVQVPSSA